MELKDTIIYDEGKKSILKDIDQIGFDNWFRNVLIGLTFGYTIIIFLNNMSKGDYIYEN